VSGGSIVSVQGGVGGIAARLEDLRSGARILGELGWSLGADVAQLRATATILCGDLVGGWALDWAGVHQVAELARDARTLGGLLDRAADQYTGSDDWTLQRIAGVAVGHYKNVLKLETTVLSLGQLDVPWDYDLRPLEAAANLYHRTEMHGILHGFAVLADWRVAPKVTGTGVDRAPVALRPPRSLDALLVSLEHRNSQEPGAVDVQILQSFDGRPRRVIVNIPGTSTFAPTVSNPTDVLGDLLGIDGTPTAYGAGIIECLELAGVSAQDEILLVGHSQGGMVATQLAAQLSGSGRFTVRNVVTVGSPIARIDLPPDVQVLALENRADLVPQLDGNRNTDSPNVVTVTVETGASGLDAHSIDGGYRPAAADLERSTDPSVQQALESLSSFLDADRVTTQTFTISRG
jgi:hypothetical protein